MQKINLAIIGILLVLNVAIIFRAWYLQSPQQKFSGPSESITILTESAGTSKGAQKQQGAELSTWLFLIQEQKEHDLWNRIRAGDMRYGKEES